MKALLVKYREKMDGGIEKTGLDVGLLIARIAFGGMMALSHGLPKLLKYSAVSDKFPDPLRVGSPVSMALAISAELFCSVFIVLGLATRLASIPLMITMSVAAFMIHAADPFFAPPGQASKEFALVYLTAFVLIFLAGPGRLSLDAAIVRWIKKK